MKETAEEVVEETLESEAVAEKEEQPVESVKEETTGSSETAIAEEEVPLAVNAGGNIPMWAVLAAVLVFVAFAGVYVYAKQKKFEK